MNTMWFGLLPERCILYLSSEVQETNYPLTERQDPSSFRNIRCPRRNAQQSKSPNTYHETLGEGSNAERNQPPSPRIDESSNPDLEAMALLRAFKSGDIGPKDGASHELGRSGWSADIEKDCQLYEQHNISAGFGRKTCNLVTEGYMDDGQEKNCLDMSSAPISGRRKVIIPNVPEFSKLLEQCT